METFEASEVPPAQILAEAQATSSRLAAALSAMTLRIVLAFAIVLFDASAVLWMFLSYAKSGDIEIAGLPIALAPALTVLSLYIAYSAVDTYLELYSKRRALLYLTKTYERAILNAELIMPIEAQK